METTRPARSPRPLGELMVSRGRFLAGSQPCRGASSNTGFMPLSQRFGAAELSLRARGRQGPQDLSRGGQGHHRSRRDGPRGLPWVIYRHRLDGVSTACAGVEALEGFGVLVRVAWNLTPALVSLRPSLV